MSKRIPAGWSYWANGGRSRESAWFHAVHMKQDRERVRPDLFVRVSVVKALGEYWIIRREEPKER